MSAESIEDAQGSPVLTQSPSPSPSPPPPRTRTRTRARDESPALLPPGGGGKRRRDDQPTEWSRVTKLTEELFDLVEATTGFQGVDGGRLPGAAMKTLSLAVTGPRGLVFLPGGTSQLDDGKGFVLTGLCPCIPAGRLCEMAEGAGAAYEEYEAVRQRADERVKIDGVRNYLRTESTPKTEEIGRLIGETTYPLNSKFQKATVGLRQALELEEWAQERSTCPVCRSTFVIPVATSCCRNVVCRECLRKSLDASLQAQQGRRWRRCPICRFEEARETHEVIADAAPCRLTQDLCAIVSRRNGAPGDS